jgi:hypothetical protein
VRKLIGGGLPAGCLLVAMLLVAAGPATSAPPQGADPNSPIGRWFKELRTPGGVPCCDVSDGRATRVRYVNDHWEAWIDERFEGGAGVGWVPIPQTAILEETDNPVGQPVVFWRPYSGVICFVRVAEV